MHLRVALLPVVRLFLVIGITLLGSTGASADTSEADRPRRQVRWYVDRGLNVEVRRLGLLEKVAGPASELLLNFQAGLRLSVDGAVRGGRGVELCPG
jgi:hypothetical protein